jgi:MYXO-CTERM domain-containing protein
MNLALLSGLTLVTLLALSTPARADVPPPDACNPSDPPGKACSNAGASYDQPGTCQAAKCTRASPDGSITYDCMRCTAGADGAAGSGSGGSGTGGTSSGSGGTSSGSGGTSTGSGGTATGGAGGTKSGSSSDDGGCAYRAAPTGGAAALMLAIGAAALAAARRRR